VERKRKRIIKSGVLALVFLMLWTLFVLYPNPYRLGVSGMRLMTPAVNAYAVEHLLDELPEEPREIERYVLRELVPYQFDWQTYGMPFYFPRVEEVLQAGTGDCKSRFVVLASIFEALEIPYEMGFSLSHFWIHYEGKEETKMESLDNAFLVQRDDGSTQLQIPKESLSDSFEVLKEGFWDHMPRHRQILFLMGPGLSFLIGAVRYKKAGGIFRRGGVIKDFRWVENE